ncbi:hypothetical protein C8F01DRAFT_1378154 [Mycena amicta]|nr:hypothetical protein C8F01DRAFT_1378154 [Mycena amicta]
MSLITTMWSSLIGCVYATFGIFTVRKFHRLRSIPFSFGTRLPHSLIASLWHVAALRSCQHRSPPMVILPTVIEAPHSFDARSRHLCPFPAYSTSRPTHRFAYPCTSRSTHSINLKLVVSSASTSVSTTWATPGSIDVHLRRRGGAGEWQGCFVEHLREVVDLEKGFLEFTVHYDEHPDYYLREPQPNPDVQIPSSRTYFCHVDLSAFPPG